MTRNIKPHHGSRPQAPPPGATLFSYYIILSVFQHSPFLSCTIMVLCCSQPGCWWPSVPRRTRRSRTGCVGYANRVREACLFKVRVDTEKSANTLRICSRFALASHSASRETHYGDDRTHLRLLLILIDTHQDYNILKN